MVPTLQQSSVARCRRLHAVVVDGRFVVVVHTALKPVFLPPHAQEGISVRSAITQTWMRHFARVSARFSEWYKSSCFLLSIICATPPSPDPPLPGILPVVAARPPTSRVITPPPPRPAAMHPAVAVPIAIAALRRTAPLNPVAAAPPVTTAKAAPVCLASASAESWE
ncbi:hypothetical protein LshimejAT787_1800080 [Lyophyllum shimeji]|uniref:Uncharacterized protein n=1 Tax=Lyophyllum shimeji TaxID=47721 RepID=A0A9P3Q0V2_LYOSH|nr:hypothetical protein LshimejAT787_1800080 [Lyophyllum shimeji]